MSSVEEGGGGWASRDSGHGSGHKRYLYQISIVLYEKKENEAAGQAAMLI